MSSTRSYSLVEPHPRTSAPYIHSARGGAGNIFKTSAVWSSKPSSTTSTSTSSSSSSRTPSSSEHKPFKSGRGGAGNTHHSSERAMFSFDEELEREMRQQAALAPVYHVGRGGAGNMIYADSSSASMMMRRSRDAETASARSGSSAGSESGADAATKAVRRSLEKGWARVVGAGGSS